MDEPKCRWVLRRKQRNPSRHPAEPDGSHQTERLLPVCCWSGSSPKTRITAEFMSILQVAPVNRLFSDTIGAATSHECDMWARSTPARTSRLDLTAFPDLVGRGCPPHRGEGNQLIRPKPNQTSTAEPSPPFPVNQHGSWITSSRSQSSNSSEPVSERSTPGRCSANESEAVIAVASKMIARSFLGFCSPPRSSLHHPPG
jgi:hypothetical protein